MMLPTWLRAPRPRYATYHAAGSVGSAFERSPYNWLPWTDRKGRSGPHPFFYYWFLTLACNHFTTSTCVVCLVMVVFHNGFVHELATKQVTANGLDATAAGKRLLCPLQYEDGCVDGQPSLAYRLWQLLDRADASGLQASMLAARTSRSVTDVQTTLESSRYFIQLPGVF